MTSQTEKKKHFKYTYCSSVARSKSNETIKYGQLLEYSVWNIYFSKSCRECDWETRSDLCFFFKKGLYEVRISGLYLNLMCFDSPELGHTIKSNWLKP